MKLRDYPTIERVDQEDGRFYHGPDGPVPSVTTILGATSDSSWIEEWRESVGAEEADSILEEAGSIGALMHSYLEGFALGRVRPVISTDLEREAFKLANTIRIGPMKKMLSEVWGTEVPLVCTSLYGGTADLVGVWRGLPAIVDWKNARSSKNKDDVKDYLLQASAYALAHEEMTGIAIKRIAIVLAQRSGTIPVKIYEADGAYLDLLIEEWLDRVSEYYAS